MVRMIEKPQVQTATFAAGCFWGVEETFRATPGVLSTEVGYCNGRTENPTYEQVCYANTNHAEAVKITYDPSRVTYAELLEIFWSNHNPTTLNRQGPDVGSQYRSGIFFHTLEQEAEARAAKQALDGSDRFGGRKIVTVIEPAATFYPAEDYHQKYLMKRGKSSCHF